MNDGLYRAPNFLSWPEIRVFTFNCPDCRCFVSIHILPWMGLSSRQFAVLAPGVSCGAPTFRYVETVTHIVAIWLLSNRAPGGSIGKGSNGSVAFLPWVYGS